MIGEPLALGLSALAFALVLTACAATKSVDDAIVFEPVARPVLRAAAGADTRDPSLAFDAGGNLWIGAVTAGMNPGYALFRSQSLGDRFQLDQIAPVHPGMLTGGQLGPRFVFDAKEFIHLIYATEQARRHDVVVARRRWYEAWFRLGADARPRVLVSDPVAIMPNATVVAVAASGTKDVVLVRGRVRQ